MVGDIKVDENDKKQDDIDNAFYAVATTDGLVMMVKKQIVLW